MDAERKLPESVEKAIDELDQTVRLHQTGSLSTSIVRAHKVLEGARDVLSAAILSALADERRETLEEAAKEVERHFHYAAAGVCIRALGAKEKA